jgi:phage terminase small subunit
MSDKELTPKQQLFISEYLIDFNATRAAIAAGYSEKTAYGIGSENLRKPQIMEHISKVIEEQLKSTKAALKKKIIEALQSIAFEPEGSEKDRMKAMELLGKYIGLWIDKVEISGELKLTDKFELVEKDASTE